MIFPKEQLEPVLCCTEYRIGGNRESRLLISAQVHVRKSDVQNTSAATVVCRILYFVLRNLTGVLCTTNDSWSQQQNFVPHNIQLLNVGEGTLNEGDALPCTL